MIILSMYFGAHTMKIFYLDTKSYFISDVKILPLKSIKSSFIVEAYTMDTNHYLVYSSVLVSSGGGLTVLQTTKIYLSNFFCEQNNVKDPKYYGKIEAVYYILYNSLLCCSKLHCTVLRVSDSTVLSFKYYSMQDKISKQLWLICRLTKKNYRSTFTKKGL